jgi:hypothetical protein
MCTDRVWAVAVVVQAQTPAVLLRVFQVSQVLQVATVNQTSVAVVAASTQGQTLLVLSGLMPVTVR